MQYVQNSLERILTGKAWLISFYVWAQKITTIWQLLVKYKAALRQKYNCRWQSFQLKTKPSLSVQVFMLFDESLGKFIWEKFGSELYR